MNNESNKDALKRLGLRWVDPAPEAFFFVSSLDILSTKS